ncbi:T9SS outer membrane translocon Sov/SprA [Hymenobacter properus]|uniref:Cell surface protein SprA n=1 Tax=Hymenobacter properus TaxID=2791026 RepID=A0A931BMU1_9BACT|nr:cell surface protein SprA [Hymenobacter properus]MBF9143163.1 cell surface protein SprA [Hymenobacter properus]MBR7721971.1 cell surface protein SprA [Microvirga sp. SRT04]
MKSGQKLLPASVVVVASLLAWWAQAAPAGTPRLGRLWLRASRALAQDTPRLRGAVADTTGPYKPSKRPRVRAHDRPGSPFGPHRRESPLVLPLPKNVKLGVTVDDSLQNVQVQEKIGSDIDYRDPSALTYKQYEEYQRRQAVADYYRQKAKGGITGPAAAPGTPQAQRLIPKIYLGPIANRIFGGSYVDIRPAGSVTLKFGARFNKNENPALTLRQQSVGDFLFEQNINVNLTGAIGTKLKLVFNYDTKASFDFDNQMKFDYAGEETDIIKKVDLGNVSLPLTNSLVQGGQNLFGIKTQLQFGRLGVTAVAATVRGTADEVRIQNGAQSRQYEIKASQYEKDRHFFLSQFFRDRYDQALRNLPTIQSGVTINRLEVYVTNDNRTTESLRNVVTLMDIAEPFRLYQSKYSLGGKTQQSPADNNANSLFTAVAGAGGTRDNLGVDNYLQGAQGLTKNIDFERVRARKLDTREYTFNAQLGYLSLNTALLPDQVLGVSYEYIYNGQTYKVGELAAGEGGSVGPDQVLFLKMLRASNPGVGLADPAKNPQNPNLQTRNTPTWDLMMKNIYPLNASQLQRDNFQLQIIYKDDQTGVDLISLKEGAKIANRPLIEVLNLDHVNSNNDKLPDGNFDYFPGVTIDPELGKIIFPNVQPFGNYLQTQLAGEVNLITKYVYSELYNQTQSDAQQVQEKDKFFLRGRFQGGSSSDEINLPGIGIAQGSVRVTSGSTLLTEGVDYQVFYDQAKVKILNPAYLNSANELRVSFEKNALVQVQPRKLVGTRLDYKLNNDVTIGGTVLHLLENQAPGINRVNIGDEPGNNTLIGLDGAIRKDSRVLTKYLDMLPFVSTKEISTIAFSGEFAKLLPGRSQLGNGENGVSYVDDFENARTPYTLGGLASIPAWRLASTPLPQRSSSAVGLPYNYERAKLAWYTIDQSYYTGGPNVPANITATDLANHYVRGVRRDEVFPNKDLGSTGNGFEYTFDMAYYPNERGPYNYNPDVDQNGKILRPNQLTANPAANINNFAGVSRAITFDTDFDNANVEYLEFWMMDPFINTANGVVQDPDNPTPKSNTTGGDLIVNLGNVSEDVLKDNNQYEFENGLPVTDNPQDIADNTNTTPYGLVSRQQFLTDAFNATPGARQRQDVGLDGLNNDAERAKAVAAAPQVGYGPAYQNLPDPSGDDFRHHLDPSYDQSNTKLLGRYKNYDGYEGNSPENSQLSSTAYPDKEDLNRDNVVQDVERYYEYRMHLKPGQLDVGNSDARYIIDKVTNTVNNEQVTWYQFRIPIRDGFTAVRGNNNQPFGFKSIRFLRMYMTGWQEPVVLRMVQPQFVANQWRRFNYSIVDAAAGSALGQNQLTDADAFNISTVSVEENGIAVASGSTPKIPYVSPPGILRDKEYGSSSTSRLQNEQSLRLAVVNLRDGYAKAAYKNLTINMLRYKRLRLFLHGDTDDPTTRSGDTRAFVRIGTDYTQNYYEYSLPLQLTDATQVTGSEADKANQVWPEANRLDVSFQDFIDAKAKRNQTSPLNVPFTVKLPNGASITVVGNPDFSAVQGVMIGVLNPFNDGADPSTSSKTVNLWADEFRVFDFEQQAGYAATARLNVKLADVANVTATGSFTSVGFGGLQDKVQQRSTDNVLRGDLNATVAAEKFLPPQLNVRLPVLLQVGQETRTPLYDPLDPDTKLEQSLLKFNKGTDAENAAAKAEYRKKVIDQTTSRSISVLNARKERAQPKPGAPLAKPRPWDLENIALSYSLTDRLHTDIRTDRDYTRSYTAAVAYVYQTTPKNYMPLASFKALDNPYLKIFKEINFTPLPSRFSFRTDIDRRYNERFLQRILNPGEVPSTDGIAPVIQKSFYVSRIYDLKWDLTKSLIFDYTATNRGVVDEGPGRTIGVSDEAVRNREQVQQNLLRGGRTTNFTQTASLTYRLPLDKFPLTDWLSADTRYSANYNWQAASRGQRALLHPTDPTDTTTYVLDLGNTIQNNAELSANGKIDLVKLYNKVKFLNIINNAPPPSAKARGPREELQSRGAPGEARRNVEKPAADTTREKNRFVKAVLRSLMTARSINFTYNRSNGTLLPGYLPKTKFFGLESFGSGDQSSLAPGIPFIIGKQYDLAELYGIASSRGWYTDQSQYLNTALSSLLTETLTLRTTLEPFRDFNIQVDARRQLARNNESYYRRRVDENTLQPLSGPIVPQSLGSGSFSTSTVTIQTLFGDLGANGETSKAFDRFVKNRGIVRDRLAGDAGTNPTGSLVGYGYNSQAVLIQSFNDAYHGKSSDGYTAGKYNPFAMLPLPNWRVDYNGFAQLPLIKRYFTSFTLNHAYSSLYNVGSYTTSNQYTGEPSIPTIVGESGQYIPYYIVNQVSIVERLSPLVGVNFQTVSKVTGRVEYRTDRSVVLNTTNAQVTELHTNEIVVGFGYATNSLKLPFRVGGEQRVLKNNLTARLDLSIRDNITVQRSINNSYDPGNTQGQTPSVGNPTSTITNGSKTMQLRPTVDYLLNTRLNLQLYYSQTITTPRISNAFRNSNTEAGVQLRYSLAQ